jgi:predicted amidophosphoribosyltransferase
MSDTIITDRDDRICPNTNCQYDNHVKGANFCVLCGTLLYHRCENCLDVNPRYSRFCYYCGSSLSEVKPSAQYEADFGENFGTKQR